MVDNQALQQELLNMGFLNYKAILQTAEPWECMPKDHPPLLNPHLMDFSWDEKDIGYIFTIGEGPKGWHIHSVLSGLQLDTVRTLEGVQVLGREYTVADGPLPDKQTMQQEIEQLLEKFQKEEQEFMVRNGITSGHSNSHRR